MKLGGGAVAPARDARDAVRFNMLARTVAGPKNGCL